MRAGSSSASNGANKGLKHVAGVPHYRLDDLRRFSSSLAIGAGVTPARAATLASYLLWYDTVGAASLGLATLPDALEQYLSGAIDPKVEGSVLRERSAATVFDGRNGVPHLVLARAGELAIEKARDTGVGLVRLLNVMAPASAASIVAEMATGPFWAWIVGPGNRWSIAVPGEGGLPVLFDPALATGEKSRKGATSPTSPPVPESVIGLWASMLTPDEGWLVAAVSIPSMEPLPSFQARVASVIQGREKAQGLLLPEQVESFREQVRRQGLSLSPGTWKNLLRWADRFGVEPPAPDSTRHLEKR
ncbi:MAG: hypothetical protein NVSMB9_12960 [Isosphaeraceae bacterium]